MRRTDFNCNMVTVAREAIPLYVVWSQFNLNKTKQFPQRNDNIKFVVQYFLRMQNEAMCAIGIAATIQGYIMSDLKLKIILQKSYTSVLYIV